MTAQRARNLRLAVLLAAVAASFFVGIIVQLAGSVA